MVWYQGNACSFRFYLSSSSFPTIPLRSADIFGLENFPALRTWLLLMSSRYVIFFRLTSKLTPHRRSLGVLEHNRQLKLGAVPSMQQAAISGDPLKREDQVEDIKRYACLGTPIGAAWGVRNQRLSSSSISKFKCNQSPVGEF